MLNAGSRTYPFHPHGNHDKLIGIDARPLRSPDGTLDLTRDEFSRVMVPGQTSEVLVTWVDAQGFSDEDAAASACPSRPTWAGRTAPTGVAARTSVGREEAAEGVRDAAQRVRRVLPRGPQPLAVPGGDLRGVGLGDAHLHPNRSTRHQQRLQPGRRAVEPWERTTSNDLLTDHAHGGSTMQTSRTRRHRLSAVAMVAVIGLGAGALTADASSGSHRMQALGVPDATPTSSLPAAASPAGCVTAGGCDLYAKPGTVDAGSHTLIPIWGFTTDNTDPLGGRLGGDPKNTIVISETDTLTINLHNSLPAGAGNLSLEIPAAQGAARRRRRGCWSALDLRRLGPRPRHLRVRSRLHSSNNLASWRWVWRRSSSCGRLATPPATPRAYGGGAGCSMTRRSS